MTRYKVLIKGDTGYWQEFASEDAQSATAAAKAAYMKNPPDSTITAIVAVPERSWNPTPIRTETQTKVVLGENPS